MHNRWLLSHMCMQQCVCVCVKCVLSVCLTPLPQSQQEKIDSIEDNVNTAAANVEEGTRSLGKVCVCLRVCVGVCVRACMCMLGGYREIDGTLPPSHSTVFVPIDPFEYGGKLQLRK